MSTKAKAARIPPAEQYATDVVAGRIVTSRWVRLACERHVRDLKDGHKRGLRFDQAAADDALEFFSLLRHSKGEWAGQPLTLEPWQQFIISSIFGWKRADGTRRFRTAHVEVARKNGKSTMVAGIALELAFFDGEPGAEVYCAATKKDQAKIVFNEAERMRRASPALAKTITSFRNNLSLPATNSKLEPLGADEDTLDGLNTHAALVDELHAHKTRGLWDVLETSTGARRQPLMFAITTAGFNRQSICWSQHVYGEKILDRIIDDDNFFVYIACLDKGDDWEDERNWPKANPNLGISVKLDDLRRKAEKAKNDPAALNSFLRLHLDLWTQQDVRWMPIDKWNECEGFDLVPGAKDPKQLREALELRLAGRPCYGGLDLSSKVDLTAFAAVFPPSEDLPRWIALVDFWMPSDNVQMRVKEDRIPYDVWIREGFINETDGNVVDYDFVKAHIQRFADRFDLRELAFDRWNAQQISNQLSGAGLQMVEFGQGFVSMSEPTKEFMAIVLGHKVSHLGNPVLRWNVDNLVVKTDEAGNIKPNKEKSGEKIDGAVALIMALGCAIRTPDTGDGAPGVFVV